MRHVGMYAFASRDTGYVGATPHEEPLRVLYLWMWSMVGRQVNIVTSHDPVPEGTMMHLLVPRRLGDYTLYEPSTALLETPGDQAMRSYGAAIEAWCRSHTDRLTTVQTPRSECAPFIARMRKPLATPVTEDLVAQDITLLTAYLPPGRSLSHRVTGSASAASR